MPDHQPQFKLDHAVLRASSFGQACEFYRQLFRYLGWEAREDYSSSTSIGFRQEDGMTIWLEHESELDTNSHHGVLDHLAFHCNSRQQVDDAFDFCQSQNWKILKEPQAYPAYGDFYGFVFEGPDNLKLEFVTR